MTIEEWALVAAVAFSGPWSGLLAMLTTILHPMMAAMDGRAFRNYMEAFLRFARKTWFNYVCSIGMGLAPIVALVALWGGLELGFLRAHRDRAGFCDRRCVRRRQRVEGTVLRRDTGLGPRGHAGGLGGGTAALLHDQLDPIRDDLVGVRPLLGGSGFPLGGPAARRP